jgi:hypothetical protein
MAFRKTPSMERLREVLDYDPDTGIFLWKQPTGNRVITNEQCTSIDAKGYYRISVDNKRFGAHRLAWVYMYDEDISNYYVNHINEDRLDNRIVNLELTTNAHNIRLSKRGKGYSYHKASGKFAARIRVNYKSIHLGYFDKEEDAAKAYAEARFIYFGLDDML